MVGLPKTTLVACLRATLLCATSEANIYIVMTLLMVRRLARL